MRPQQLKDIDEMLRFDAELEQYESDRESYRHISPNQGNDSWRVRVPGMKGRTTRTLPEAVRLRSAIYYEMETKNQPKAGRP